MEESSHLDLNSIAASMRNYLDFAPAKVDWKAFLEEENLMTKEQLEEHADWLKKQALELQREREQDQGEESGEQEHKRNSDVDIGDLFSRMSQVFSMEEEEEEDIPEEEEEGDNEEEEGDSQEQQQEEDEERKPRRKSKRMGKEAKPKKRKKTKKQMLKERSKDPKDLPLNLCVGCKSKPLSVACIYEMCRKCCWKKQPGLCRYHTVRIGCVSCNRPGHRKCEFVMCKRCCLQSNPFCAVHKHESGTGLRLNERMEVRDVTARLWVAYANGRYWEARTMLKKLLLVGVYYKGTLSIIPYDMISFCVGLARKQGSRVQVLNMLENGFNWMNENRKSTRQTLKEIRINAAIDVLYAWEEEKMKQDDFVAAELESRIESFPSNSRLETLLAYEYEQEEKFASAITHYDRAINLDHPIEAVNGLIRVYGGCTDPRSVKLIKNALQFHPKYYPFWILYRESKPDKAKIHYKILELDKTNAVSLNWLSEGQRKFRSFEKSAKCFANALMYLRDDDSLYWEQLFQCLQCFDKYKAEQMPLFWKFFMHEMLSEEEQMWSGHKMLCRDLLQRLVDK